MAERILIVTDDSAGATLREPLAKRGYEVFVAGEANDAYQQLVESPFDLVIINLAAPITGAELVKRIRSNSNLNRLIVLTVAEWGSGQPTLALAQGADGFEPKPIDEPRLVEAVEKLLRPRMAMTARASTNGDAEE